MNPKADISAEEIRRIASLGGRIPQWFTTQAGVLSHLVDIRRKHGAKFVRVNTERLPGGGVMFHGEVGPVGARTTHDALVTDIHAEEVPIFSGSNAHIDVVVDDITNAGADRCLHVFGVDSDHAALMWEAVAFSNAVLGDKSALDCLPDYVGESLLANGMGLRSRAPLVTALSYRQMNPELVTDWSTSARGRLFLESRLSAMEASGITLRACALPHASLVTAPHVFIDSKRDDLLVKVGPQVQDSFDALQLYVGSGNSDLRLLPLDGVPYDEAAVLQPSLPGCRGVHRNPFRKSSMESKFVNLRIGPSVAESVMDKWPGCLIVGTEVQQLREGRPSMWNLDLMNDDERRSLWGRFGRSVKFFDELAKPVIGLMEARLDPHDPYVALAINAHPDSGPKKWGDVRTDNGYQRVNSTIDTTLSGNPTAPLLYVVKKYSPVAAAVLRNLDAFGSAENRQIADYFRVQLHGLATQALGEFEMVRPCDTAITQALTTDVAFRSVDRSLALEVRRDAESSRTMLDAVAGGEPIDLSLGRQSIAG
jgi:hypothetical protein